MGKFKNDLSEAKIQLDSINKQLNLYKSKIDIIQTAVLNQLSVNDEIFEFITKTGIELSDDITKLNTILEKINTNLLNENEKSEFLDYCTNADYILEDVINYETMYNSLVTTYSRHQICILKSQIEQSENKILNQAITIMGIFISIFSLIIPNLALFSNNNNLSMEIVLLVNGTALSVIVSLMVIIGIITERKKVSKILYLYIPASVLITLGFTI